LAKYHFKLPASAMIDFRTISIFADVSLYNNVGNGTANYSLHLPRNTASLIQQLTITCNGVQLCNINDYNLLYNTLYDIEGADSSQTSKRFFSKMLTHQFIIIKGQLLLPIQA
jgi:hypothetical protein